MLGSQGCDEFDWGPGSRKEWNGDQEGDTHNPKGAEKRGWRLLRTLQVKSSLLGQDGNEISLEMRIKDWMAMVIYFTEIHEQPMEGSLECSILDWLNWIMGSRLCGWGLPNRHQREKKTSMWRRWVIVELIEGDLIDAFRRCSEAGAACRLAGTESMHLTVNEGRCSTRAKGLGIDTVGHPWATRGGLELLTTGCDYIEPVRDGACRSRVWTSAEERGLDLWVSKP